VGGEDVQSGNYLMSYFYLLFPVGLKPYPRLRPGSGFVGHFLFPLIGILVLQQALWELVPDLFGLVQALLGLVQTSCTPSRT
jgi:hypothetical protein